MLKIVNILSVFAKLKCARVRSVSYFFDALLLCFLPEAVLRSRLLQAIFVDYIGSIAILLVAVVCFLFGLLVLLLDENPISLRIMNPGYDDIDNNAYHTQPFHCIFQAGNLGSSTAEQYCFSHVLRRLTEHKLESGLRGGHRGSC